MHTAIAVTLLLAGITSGLGMRRAMTNFTVRPSWFTALPFLTATVMMLWFMGAAFWSFRHA